MRDRRRCDRGGWGAGSCTGARSARFEQEQEERRGRGTWSPRGDKLGGGGQGHDLASVAWQSGIGPTARLHAGSNAEYS